MVRPGYSDSGAWLFTLGYLHLPFWKGVLAILLWPYYLGGAFASH